MANTLTARATSYVATVVAITTEGSIDETSTALEALRSRSAVRTILITLGEKAQPAVDRSDEATVILELLPPFVNNAVAALRLSSLPSLAWWRRPESHLLGEIAHLVDRIVLDVADPGPAWNEARRLREVTSFSDVRWTQLTRWRSLMAQFFDLPDVRSAAESFTRLEITASDTQAARLFAAWMRTRLPRGKALDISITADESAQNVLTAVTVRGNTQQLGLRMLANNTCVETSVAREGQPDTVRVVPLGRPAYAAMLAEEMRVRARDVAFEEALEGVMTI
jgi:glucose-6-phosphate dehydrogenase assembly protein OpcA